MKNVVIVVLLIAVGVLGFLLYRDLQAKQAGRRGRPETHPAPYQTTDHKGQPITVVDCPTIAGQNNDVCIIPISYLEGMSGASDYGIVVHRNWTIVWYGDQGETLNVQPLPGRDCVKHGDEDAPDPNEKNLTPTISPQGVVQFAQVTSNTKHYGHCFKTTVIVTPKNGTPTTYDPHMFDSGP